MTDDEIAFLIVIGAGLFVLAFSFGFAAGYITRSAKSHRRRREPGGAEASVSADWRCAECPQALAPGPAMDAKILAARSLPQSSTPPERRTRRNRVALSATERNRSSTARF
jgi:hypothetical protein